MNTAQQYAQALHEVVSAHPNRGATYLKNLRDALERRGHAKLLPRIWSEYQKLIVYTERVGAYKKITPDMNRTRTLLELYQKLIAAK